MKFNDNHPMGSRADLVGKKFKFLCILIGCEAQEGE